VGDKTFQQITEEFAELIIPKVWEREGRKISRVTTRLSISPTKVRRILGASGPAEAVALTNVAYAARAPSFQSLSAALGINSSPALTKP
jgi:hypothetical protein